MGEQTTMILNLHFSALRNNLLEQDCMQTTIPTNAILYV